MAVLWDVVPCGTVDADRRFRGAAAISINETVILMMEAVSSSET
jgi:hypothetical protein